MPNDPIQNELDVFEFFGPPIHVYTRAQAIADGVLIDGGEDVQKLVREAGFKYHLAFTAGAWHDVVAWDQDNGTHQDVTGRLWDVLMVLHYAAKQATGARVDFEVLRVPNKPGATRATTARLYSLCGPGDATEPVLTVLLPSED